MDTFEKFASVGQYLKFEVDEETTSSRPSCSSGEAARQKPAKPQVEDVPVFRAAMPGGRRITLLKTLLTTVCERDCAYCAFRSGRDVQRTSFSPDEMARGFMKMYQAGRVEGLFLSSGVAGGGRCTQDRLLAVAEILRKKLGFRGYLHLKIMPGAEKAQVEQAMLLADRVSVNLEGPNPLRLATLAPHKLFDDELLRPLQWVEDIRSSQPPHKAWNGRWPSTCTQFVVGGVGERDVELLTTTERLYRSLRLKRAYYSRFNPIVDTPLENQPPENPRRQARLYQASFLLRDYGFDLEELPFTPAGNLPLDADPKLAWARANLAGARTELNRASREELLKIPGIGPRGAAALLDLRRQGRLKRLDQLQTAGVIVSRAAPFILLDGRALPVQLPLL